MKLTGKQKRFCEEYVIDFNATRAAIQAGYSERTAKEMGYQNLLKPVIQSYISSIGNEYVKKVKQKEKNSIESDLGYIYLIRCIGTHYYKIGKTIRPPIKRMASMQTGIPFDLEMVDNWKKENHTIVEKRLHGAFIKHLIRGEWYCFSDAILSEAIELISKYQYSKRQLL